MAYISSVSTSSEQTTKVDVYVQSLIFIIFLWTVNSYEFISCLIMYMKTFLHSDWLRAVQFFFF